jgi:membrane protein involved in colicin uptake
MSHEEISQLIGNQEIISDLPRRGPGRPSNTLKAEMLNITISSTLRDQLEDITSTGLFGKSVAETANMLLWHAMGECVEKRVAQSQAIKELRKERAVAAENRKKLDEAQKKREQANQLKEQMARLHAEAEEMERSTENYS